MSKKQSKGYVQGIRPYYAEYSFFQECMKHWQKLAVCLVIKRVSEKFKEYEWTYSD